MSTSAKHESDAPVSCRPRLVVLSGAGISAESGLRTFRGADGYWREYRAMELATPQAWKANRDLVLEFYNERRRAVVAAEPNAAHRALAALESVYGVVIITQNVDNLHERAGSSQVIHLHGEIMKSRSTLDHRLVYDTHGEDIRPGDRCSRGSQLRPHIVWFGEAVQHFDEAVGYVRTADAFMVIGTSLAVYPAASLVDHVPSAAQKFLVTLETERLLPGYDWRQTNACDGVPAVCAQLRSAGAR